MCMWSMLSCVVTYFLEVGASALSGASTATNLDKKIHENLRVSIWVFKTNKLGCPFFTCL